MSTYGYVVQAKAGLAAAKKLEITKIPLSRAFFIVISVKTSIITLYYHTCKQSAIATDCNKQIFLR
jgi:hypothetical protein